MPPVRVRPTGDATHDLSLSDGKRTFGIKLLGGAPSIQETPATPTTVQLAGGQAYFGDYDPSLAHIEQRDWSGGRGLENLRDDLARYYDGTAWTLTPDMLLSGLQWQMTSGTNTWNVELPGSVTWKGLYGDDRFLARSFAPTTTYNSSQSAFWLRRVGNPGNPTLAIYSSAATAVPDTATASLTPASSAITADVVSVFFQSTYAAVAISTGKTYYSVVAGNSSDTARDHWEVACGSSANGGLRSSNGTAWTAAGYYPYYGTFGPGLPRKWHFFSLSSANGTSMVLHAVSQYDDGVTPSSTVRLTSTGGWTSVTWTSALTGVVTDVAVLDNVAYMARKSTAGGTTSLFQAQVQAASDAGNTMGTTDIGDLVHAFYDPVDGPQVVRAVSTAARMYRASTAAFGTTHTWKPSTGIPLGDAGPAVVDIEDYDNQMYARKQDSLWAIKNDRAAKINVGLDDAPSTGMYVPMMAKELYLYIGWSFSLERLYGGTLDDVGLWRGAGLPSSRVGTISCLEGAVGWLFAGVDAGSTGISGVYAWDGRGWHEIFRAPAVGWRVQNIKYWSPPGVRPRLFISCAGAIFSIAFPYRSLHPSRDAGVDAGNLMVSFQHESVLETATIDMGAAGLEKLFDELQVRSKNLNSTGTEIKVDYQMDDDIGGSTWIELPGALRQSPSDELKIRQGNKKAIRLRYRLNTNSNTVPVEVRATILKAAARTPVKRRWSIRSKSGSFQVDLQGNQDAKPDDFYMFWQDAAVRSVPLHMRSRWESMDDVWVFAEPPVVRRTYRTPDGSWGLEADLTLREL